MGSKSAKGGGGAKVRIAAVGEDRRKVRALLAQVEPAAKVIKEKKAEGDDLVAMSLASYQALVLAGKAGAAAPAASVRRAAAARPPKADRDPASVRVWRERRGLTQEQLARKVGLSKSFLSEIENGKKTGSVKTLRAIAEALEIELARLAV